MALTRLLVLTLLLASLATRVLGIDHPREVIFDEVHFGKFITAYCCTGERFFDIHPPHAKLLIAGAAWLGGYQGDFSFEHIGQVYPAPVPVTWLRLVPALVGTLLPLIVYVLMRQFGGSPLISFAAGWLVLLDNAQVVQSRLISLDTVLLGAVLGSLSLFLWARQQTGWRQWVGFSLTGLAAGLAAGSKFTGLAALLLLGTLLLVALVRTLSWRTLIQIITAGVLILCSASVSYVAGWGIHYQLLTSPGSGDAFHLASFADAPWPVAFLRETIELHQVMFNANYNLTATHPYASQWWTWPIMQRPVFYWQSTERVIYFIGNPLVWWGSSVLLVIALASLIMRFSHNRQASMVIPAPHLLTPLLGYAIALVPLVRVPRALFLYHYLMPLLFALILGLLWLEASGYLAVATVTSRHTWQQVPTREKVKYLSLLAVAGVAFIIFSPVTYGYAVPEWWRANLVWLTTWR